MNEPQGKPMLPPPRRRALSAYAVHGLTASGALVAMLALLAAASGRVVEMFYWLGLALFIDGLDGPLARWTRVERNAPRVDGVLMDLIIDFLTYVFIPAYALFESGLLPGFWNVAALALIVVGGVLYFADRSMKTADASFSGFPGCWNMVIFVAFVTEPPASVVVALVSVLTIAQFLPVRFVHPVRTHRWRRFTLAVLTGWSALGLYALAMHLQPPGWARTALTGASIYLLAAGATQQLLRPRVTR